MDWHERFLQQAAWTEPLRTYLFKKAGLQKAQRVLEVGCGTGAVLRDLDTQALIYGIDILAERTAQARLYAPSATLACADAQRLPFLSETFDITFCHFLLLWVRDPIQVLREMKRVTRPGGYILALAEPDYTARQDKPEELALLGSWQTDALRQQGANPGIGAQLLDLFSAASIPCRETGVLHSDTAHPEMTTRDFELEWQVLESDLAGLLPSREIRRYKRLDRAAWLQHTRLLYVPTHWAFGICDTSGEIH
jgi:SAM-dependent methyltransferase